MTRKKSLTAITGLATLGLALFAKPSVAITVADVADLAPLAVINSLPPKQTHAHPPAVTYTPQGQRTAGDDDQAGQWTSRHGDSRNSDEVTRVGAPEYQLTTVLGPDELYLQAVSVDRHGNVYGSPSVDSKNTLLVSYGLDGTERFRVVSEEGVSGGAVPIVVADPATGAETVFTMSRTRAIATTTDGELIWDAATGLAPSDNLFSAVWGPTYIEKIDAIIGVSGDGELVALDRGTGKVLLQQPFELPGIAPAVQEDNVLPAPIVAHVAAVMSDITGVTLTPEDTQTAIQLVLGGGTEVSNYHGVSQATSTVWLSAGSADPERGAIFALNLSRDGDVVTPLITCEKTFSGGSASSPSLSADESVIYVADEAGSLIALDPGCQEKWRYDLGEQIIASPSVARDNGEVYVITGANLFQVLDRGDSAALGWKADFNLYKYRPLRDRLLTQGNMLTALITANGVYAQAGMGVVVNEKLMPASVGVARIDRRTGETLWYDENPGDSVATLAIAPDGSVLVPQSPVRMAVVDYINRDLVGEMTGGISVMRADHRLVIRDAVCLAPEIGQTLKRDISTSDDAVVASYATQIEELIAQARENRDALDESGAEYLTARLDDARQELAAALTLQARERFFRARRALDRMAGHLVNACSYVH